jgi:hypothetical protein
MKIEDVVRAAGRGKEAFEWIRSNAWKLDLPSPYSSDFLPVILLAVHPVSMEEWTTRLREAKERLAAIRSDPALSTAPSSELPLLLACALLPGSGAAESRPPAPTSEAAPVSKDVRPPPEGVAPDPPPAFELQPPAVELQPPPVVLEPPAVVLQPPVVARRPAAADENRAAKVEPPSVPAARLCVDCSGRKTYECDECGTAVSLGVERRCRSFEECETAYCPSCAARLLDSSGLCWNCTADDGEDCSGCDEAVLASRVAWCARHGDCGNGYCSRCEGLLA